jgi:hypothetical protein
MSNESFEQVTISELVQISKVKDLDDVQIQTVGRIVDFDPYTDVGFIHDPDIEVHGSSYSIDNILQFTTECIPDLIHELKVDQLWRFFGSLKHVTRENHVVLKFSVFIAVPQAELNMKQLKDSMKYSRILMENVGYFTEQSLARCLFALGENPTSPLEQPKMISFEKKRSSIRIPKSRSSHVHTDVEDENEADELLSSS